MDNIPKQNKRKLKKFEEMTKEQIRQAILKKRECETKAQRIVESLLETNITEDYFLTSLCDINQSHLQDIIEERSIIHVCGYPLCDTPLSAKDIPKQKYRISMKTNKVYDITSRKNFCSNKCFESCMFVKNQMLTSPLWFREHEDKPKFHLHPEITSGKLGQEIDVSIIEKIASKSSDKSQFTTINDFTSASLLDIVPDKTENETEISQNVNKNSENRADTDIGNPVNECSANSESSEPTPSNLIENIQLNSIINPNNDNKHNIVGEIFEKEEKNNPATCEKSQNSIKKSKRGSKQIKFSITAVTIDVEKCLAEWFTLDTMIFLFGEEKVREMVSDKGDYIREYMNNYAKSISYTSNSYDQYQSLCRKLNLLEMEDKKMDQKETKPLPDYSVLQEESKRLQLKVKAFYTGVTEIAEPDKTEINNTIKDGENITNLPLVDNNAQNALRRNIVCNQLNKVLPDLLRSLGLLTLSISSDVRFLVNTFKLKANNIMFKPIQWTLIAIVIIKLLSLRCPRVKYLLEQQTAYAHMQLLLLSYKQQEGYLDRLISWLTDVDRLLETKDTHLTDDN